MDELNKKVQGLISESLRPSVLDAAKISAIMGPSLDQQALLQNVTENLKAALPQRLDFPYTAMAEAVRQAQISAMEVSASFTVNYLPGMAAAIETLNNSAIKAASESIKITADYLSSLQLTAIQSPFIKWLDTFDFSLWRRVLEGVYKTERKKKDLHHAYLQLMYDCEWFPYVAFTANLTLFGKINEIVKSSRGKSKRRKARIDKTILESYTPKRIKAIKMAWRDSDLEPHIKKMLGQALEAHLRGEYALTITCLATMWEGLIRYKANVTGRRQSKKTKEDFAKLTQENDYETIFSDYYENFIVSQINTDDDVIEGVPNRNGVSHSKYKKYPNKKASLNAILLTDFIIGLTPKEIVAENGR